MKKYLFVICAALLLSVPCSARMTIIPLIGQGGSGGGGVSAPCSECGTCGGCDSADIACEDWDTDLCSWVDDTDSDAAGVISHTASHSGTWDCTDKGTQCLDVQFDDDTDGDCFTRLDMGEAKNTEGVDYFAHFSFKLLSAGDMGDFNQAGFFYFDSSTTPGFGNTNLRLVDTGSNIELYVYINGSTLGVDNDTVIAVGTKYEIGLRWKFVAGADNDEIELYVDGVSQGSKTDTDFGEAPQYLFLGNGAVNSTIYNVHFQIDNLEIDDDTMPSDCPT